MGRYRLALGSILVVASMAAMFELPPGLFLAATFVGTSCMAAVSILLGGYKTLFRPSGRSVGLGIGSAALLYLAFLGGNYVVALHPLGISSANENSIYSLIASPSNPLYAQVLLLIFDAVGYESFFRGVLQRRAEPKLGVAAPLVVALADSAIHILTLNPLWVVTTFIADVAWGLTYHFTKDLTSNMTSHLLWDVLIFLIIPIR